MMKRELQVVSYGGKSGGLQDKDSERLLLRDIREESWASWHPAGSDRDIHKTQ